MGLNQKILDKTISKETKRTKKKNVISFIWGFSECIISVLNGRAQLRTWRMHKKHVNKYF